MRAGAAARGLTLWSKLKNRVSKIFTTIVMPEMTAIKFCKGCQAKVSKCQITFWITKVSLITAETASWVD